MRRAWYAMLQGCPLLQHWLSYIFSLCNLPKQKRPYSFGPLPLCSRWWWWLPARKQNLNGPMVRTPRVGGGVGSNPTWGDFALIFLKWKLLVFVFLCFPKDATCMGRGTWECPIQTLKQFRRHVGVWQESRANRPSKLTKGGSHQHFRIEITTKSSEDDSTSTTVDDCAQHASACVRPRTHNIIVKKGVPWSFFSDSHMRGLFCQMCLVATIYDVSFSHRQSPMDIIDPEGQDILPSTKDHLLFWG